MSGMRIDAHVHAPITIVICVCVRLSLRMPIGGARACVQVRIRVHALYIVHVVVGTSVLRIDSTRMYPIACWLLLIAVVYV